MEIATQTARLTISGERARCSGDWIVRNIANLEEPAWPAEGELVFECTELGALDTTGAWRLLSIVHRLESRGLKITLTGLRPEFSKLLQLVLSCRIDTDSRQDSPGLLQRIGQRSWQGYRGWLDMLAFIGQTSIILAQSLMHPSTLRYRPVLHNLQSAGFDALPIVGLLSLLMGLVIAYQGADQLQRFGANIFIADLVGLSMLRELSPLLTAIIVAGRSGSAYAAQIGTMKVTEEIDALRTIGIGPTQLLVLPKLIALVIALPLLTVYADIAGVLGGMIMARSKLDVGFDVFVNRLGDAVSLSSFATGIAKAPVFAAIIALVGCHQGFCVTGSADSVGRQTTVSVVQAIFLVILTDALFSIAFNWLKI